MEMQKKTIIIEAQRIFRKKKHGMDFVALGLIRELQKIDTFTNYIIAVGPGEDICITETNNFKIEILPSTNYLVWEQVLLPRLVRKHRADLLHCTSNTAPVLCTIPLVLTLHDIIFMEDKIGKNASMYQKLGRIYRRFVLPVIIRRVNQIITVSNFEKDNILQRYPEVVHKIHAVYNGVSSAFKPTLKSTVTDLLTMEKGSFWLFLGNTDPKKNMRNTLRGYALYLNKSTIRRKLLLLDTDTAVLDAILKELDITSIKPYLISKDYISHAQLPEWYSHAFGSLYTSLRESFGLPLIEAMACGTPVVGSSTSAIPEIAGESIVYIDPMVPESIAEGMVVLENDPLLYQQKQAAGLVQSAHYTWQNTARETLSIYQLILK